MSDHLSIKDLPDLSRIEDHKSYLIPGSWLKATNAVLGQLWRGENISKGKGIRIRSGGEGGLTISAASSESSSGSSSSFPFQVNIETLPGSLFKAWVNEESSLLLSLIPDNRQAITGLGKDAAFNLDGNDFIWLEISFSATDGSIKGATIKSYGLGGSWDVSSKPSESGKHSYVEYTTTTDVSGNTIYIQSLARIPIAQTIAGASGAPQLNQMLDQNLMFTAIVTDIGLVMAYAIPWGNGLYLDKNDQAPPPGP